MRMRVAVPGAFIALFSALGNVQAQPSLTVLHNFTYPLHGTGPNPVVRDAAGNLFGSTATGGTANAGVVFKIDARGVQTVLYNFTGGADGGNPVAGVILDSLGNLFGTTIDGGIGVNTGVVYKVDPRGNETVLHAFTGGADGARPYAALTLDSAGNLYGTTVSGGLAGHGVAFKLDPSGRDFRVLHTFGFDEGIAYFGVVLDSAGNLYGTAYYDRLAGAGVVFKLDPSGRETVLHTFANGPDGAYLSSGVVLDAAGNLYGTTDAGGIVIGGLTGFGVVYQLDPSGNETVLYRFRGGLAGANPQGGVILDSDGNLYGTTQYGGSAGMGLAYELTPSGNEKVLHSFNGGADGSNPSFGVIRDPSGHLFGTTSLGGAANFGVVYELAPNGRETLTYTFAPDVGGLDPITPLTLDAAGNLYGTTYGGGTAGLGVVFKIDPSGNETVLHNFTGPPDGRTPQAGVVFDSAGNLYGTTYYGGAVGGGTVYKLDPSGNETVIHSFAGGSDGEEPAGPIALDAAGNIYGTTALGGSSGTNGYGVLYRLDPAGNETILHVFTSYSDGGGPADGVVLDPAGNLYVASGNVYKFDPAGNETVFFSFPGGSGGIGTSGVVLDDAGNFYGTAYGTGGTQTECGLVFKLDPSANETVLFTFPATAPCGADGAAELPVVVDSNGYVYGTTLVQDGNVYRVSPQGVFTLLYTFTGGVDGANPFGGVTLDAAGNLYGTTQSGGTGGGGEAYKITGAVPQN